ncbi:MAG: TonB-dependent receptor [Bryobacterales bacterium]|nr:TonB-dependent receptor [Bryobacterales bacterium]
MIAWVAAALVLFLLPALAAGATCTAHGVVTDTSGAVVPNAAVSLATAARLVLASGRSHADGRFSLGPLPCGDYVLSVARDGLAESRRLVRLTTVLAPIAVELVPVPVEEQLTVTAEAGAIGSTLAVDARVTAVPRLLLQQRVKSVLTESAQGETGVHEQRTAPAMGSFLVRGLTGKNVSVYRDGFRYTTAIQRGGVSTFQNLVSPDVLDRVEFVRGSNSAQYGSDSIGGTVNLLSAAVPEGAGRISGQATAFGDTASATFGSSLLLAVMDDRWDIVSVLNGQRVNTVRAAQGLDSHAAVTRFFGLPAHILGERLPDTGFTQYGGSFHGQFRARPERQLVVHYERGQQDGAKRYDQLAGGDGNLIADLRNLMLDFGYLRHHAYAWGPLDHLMFGVSYNAQREERVNQGGQGNPVGSISHQYERVAAWGVSLLAQKRAGVHDLALGGEGYLERVAAPSFTYNPASGAVASARARVPDGARYLSHGVFVQDAWQPFRRLRVSGSLRFGGASYQSLRTLPRDSLAANGLTGRVGASYNVAASVFLHGRYSRGFRVPNITDLGTLGLQGNGAFEANPNDVIARGGTIGDRADDRAQATGRPVERLRPEYSNNYEGGVSLQHRTVRAEFTAFRMDLGNTIVSQTLLLPSGAVGQPLGDQVITRQLVSGAVYVPLSTGPVLVRSNYFGARLWGLEHALRLALTPHLSFQQNLTYVRAEDERTGLPPDIEPGIPPLTVNPTLRYTRHRLFVEPYALLAGRQKRLSSLALADRRIGATRSRANIANFFNNGARVRGLVSGGRLLATGETLEQVQNRVLGTAASAPLYSAIPGYGLFGLRAGVPLGARGDVFVDFSNAFDKTYRGIGWGIAGTGRSLLLRYRLRF